MTAVRSGLLLKEWACEDLKLSLLCSRLAAISSLGLPPKVRRTLGWRRYQEKFDIVRQPEWWAPQSPRQIKGELWSGSSELFARKRQLLIPGGIWFTLGPGPCYEAAGNPRGIGVLGYTGILPLFATQVGPGVCCPPSKGEAAARGSGETAGASGEGESPVNSA